MATWYRPQTPAKPPAQPAAKPTTPAPRKASWAQLRSRMAMADDLLAGWVESIGSCEREEEVVLAAVAPKLTAVTGTRIDAQFIAVQRTQLAAVPARASQDAPMRLLQQISLGSRYRLAAVVA